ncbi:SCD domain-containing protein [Plasmodiophora brassicae]
MSSGMTTPRRRSSRIRVERHPASMVDLPGEGTDDDTLSDVATDDDDEEEPVPKRMKTPSKKKGSVTPSSVRSQSRSKSMRNTPSRRNVRPVQPDEFISEDTDEDDGQLKLIDVLLDSTSKARSMKEAAASWKALFDHDTELAVASIVSLLLNCCGSRKRVPADILNSDLTESSLMKPFEQSAKTHGAHFGVSNPSKGAAKKFEARMRQFVYAWITVLLPDAVFESDVLNRVLEWVVAVSRNGLRTFRLTACCFAFAIGDALITAHGQIKSDLGAAEKAMSGAGSRNKRQQQQLKSDCAEYQSQLTHLHELILSIYQDVFVARYRDVHPAVRETSIETVTQWILHYPPFATVDSFKYLGWALNSSQASVRGCAVRSIACLVRSDAVRPKMESFLNRFIKRIIEMHNDIDPHVAASAIDTCTAILVQDDVLTDVEVFGEVSPLLWDKNRAIREAAARYIFEDSFSTSASENSDMLEDIEQLFTIYIEGRPPSVQFDVSVACLVDLFFYKVKCLRDASAIVATLRKSPETQTEENASLRSAFISQLLVACSQMAATGLDHILGFSQTRLTRAQTEMQSAAAASFSNLRCDPDFTELVTMFQAESTVIIALCDFLLGGPADEMVTIPSCLTSVLVAAFNRETSPSRLRPLANALSMLSARSPDAERALEEISVQLIQSAQAHSVDDSDDARLQRSACYARTHCLAQQAQCDALLESQVFDSALQRCVTDLSADHEDVDIIDSVTVASLLKVAHACILWKFAKLSEEAGDHGLETTHNRFSVVLECLSSLFRICDTFPSNAEDGVTPELLCAIAADLSAASLGKPSIRHWLTDDLFHQLYDVIAQHPGSEEIVKSAALLVCSFCPQHVEIASTLLCQLYVNDSAGDENVINDISGIIKAMVTFLRGKRPQSLAQAIVEALESSFEDGRDKQALMMAKRLSLSYGLTATPDAQFDRILIAGIDHVVMGQATSKFLSLLHPFMQRCAISVLPGVIRHLDDVISQILEDDDSELRPALIDLKKGIMKRLGAAASGEPQPAGEPASEITHDANTVEGEPPDHRSEL